MREEDRNQEARAVPEGEPMMREERAPSNVTPMMREAVMPVVSRRIGWWGSVLAGTLIALASWLVLNTIGYAIAFGTTSIVNIGDLRSVGVGVGIWVAVSAVIAFFIGSYAASRFSDDLMARDGLWHGLSVWALTLVSSVVLSTLVLSGLLTFIGNWVSAVLGIPNTVTLTPASVQTVVDVTTTAALYFFLASLATLGGALLGGWLGSRRLSRAEAMRAIQEEMSRPRMAA